MMAGLNAGFMLLFMVLFVTHLSDVNVGSMAIFYVTKFVDGYSNQVVTHKDG